MTNSNPRRKPAAPKTNAAGQTPDESAADHIVNDWSRVKGGVEPLFVDHFRHDVLEALRSARAQGRKEGLEEAAKVCREEAESLMEQGRATASIGVRNVAVRLEARRDR